VRLTRRRKSLPALDSSRIEMYAVQWAAVIFPVSCNPSRAAVMTGVLGCVTSTSIRYWEHSWFGGLRTS
jgi:hypothetical protein